MEIVPKSETAARTARLQDWIRSKSLDAVFLFQNVDVFYFAGSAQSGLFAVPASGEPLYLVQKSLSRARAETYWERILPFPGFKKLPEWLAGEGMKGLRRVGIEMDVLPASYYLKLREHLPGVEFTDASDAIRRIRMIKSEYEVLQIRQAAAMLGVAFDNLRLWIRPGVTEIDLAGRLEGLLRSLGHQGLVRTRGFNNQIGYGALSGGPSAAYPTSFPGPVGSEGLYPALPEGAGRRPLGIGEPLMADIVGGYGGYIADKTRVFMLGEPARELAQAHRFTLDLNREIEAMLKPGSLSSKIYQTVLERVKGGPYSAGFMGAADGQVRFVGHGVGLELDELPVLAGGFDIPLQPGMTIAVEPKIIFPERGGVGIENTYLITATGFENLTKYPEDIIVIEVP